MLDLTNDRAEICVVGRTEFSSGIGAIAFAACELLARSFPVCILPVRGPRPPTATVVLPNGRPIPVCQDLAAVRVFVYTDVLWNGAQDLEYTSVPSHSLRVAHIAYDSDELPPRWVEILNDRFDLALFTSRHLEAVALSSGVRIPVGTLPIGLDLEAALARTHPLPRGPKVRFGSLAAWHERKDNSTLVEAFLEQFRNDPDVELVLHSNLAMGETFDEIARLVADSTADNVLISHKDLTQEEKNELLDSIDIMVSCSRGEGYSIAPREALARGCVLALSEIGAHTDLFGVPGVFGIPPATTVPARYPEIDNQVFGTQTRVARSSVGGALRQAYEYLRADHDDDGVRLRKERAAEFSFGSLAPSYAEIVDPDLRAFRTNAPRSPGVHLPERRGDPGGLGSRARNLSARNWVIIPAQDAGFLSMFNVFMSHLAWDLNEDRCHMVIPDWDVSRLQQRSGPPMSFCYGRPEDGNVWCRLFEPLYGLSEADMNDVDLWTRKGVSPDSIWNEHREPLLTHVYAYDLYRSPSFQQFRRRYHRTLGDHVRLLPHFTAEFDAFTPAFDGKFVIAAHVKHPSHVIEQPDGVLAETHTYIERIKQEAARRGLHSASADWRVFLATDQDSVVVEFEQAFGDRLLVFRDVRRTSLEEAARQRQLSPAELARPGHQVQHQVASSPAEWSVRMAWEVLRDVLAMSRCDVLLHVVSNVATAVSYFNPDVEMIFCHPATMA